MITEAYHSRCNSWRVSSKDSMASDFSTLTHMMPSEIVYLPTFFWDISVRFLCWECWDFWRRHDHFRRFPKKSEVCRNLPKASSLPVLFTSKIRDREEGIVIYSFYTWFSFLTWVWVNIFLEIVSSKTATTHIFQSGVRNWPAGVRSKFSTRGVRLTPKAWELAGICWWC